MRSNNLSTEIVISERYNVQPMTVVERFRIRVLGLMEERGITQKSLRGNKTEGWISNIVTGKRGIRLDSVEDIADALNVPVAELVRRPGDTVYDLTGAEARLIEAFRKLSKTEQEALLTMATLRFRHQGRPTQQEARRTNTGKMVAVRQTS